MNNAHQETYGHENRVRIALRVHGFYSSRPALAEDLGPAACIDFERGSLDLGRLNVLIIPDKFKGTLPAQAAAEAIARGWLRGRPGDTVSLLPMSDGGDGFGEVMGHLLGAEVRQTETMDAAHRPCLARWWLDSGKRMALIDSAAVIGLAMLPPGQFHPFQLDTFGLGVVLEAARASGANKCLVGIGGSATNDAGFGLARALGWQFLDQAGQAIRCWTGLTSLCTLQPPASTKPFENCLVAVDVQNPLLGAHGASRVYGPQKGLRPGDFETAEACLGRLAEVAHGTFGEDLAAVPGTGAAGGLGFGLLAFVSARLQPGFEMFAEQADLERRLRSSDLVITGEGAIDASTLMGKGVGQVARRCRQLGVPCLALAGRFDLEAESGRVFFDAHALTTFTTPENAQREPGRWLEQLAAEVAARMK